MDFLQNHIEALIFCSPNPIKLVDIKSCLSEMFNADVPEEDIHGAIKRIEEKYVAEEFSFQLFKAAGGYQFLTKPAYQASIGIMLKQQSKKRLSTSAMETLSIIAYKQPISKTEIENIRGVNCDYAVQKLLDKSLIEITGKADSIGRPMLYGTTAKFMEYFGVNDLAELPVPREISGDPNTIGENIDSKESDLREGSGMKESELKEESAVLEADLNDTELHEPEIKDESEITASGLKEEPEVNEPDANEADTKETDLNEPDGQA